MVRSFTPFALALALALGTACAGHRPASPRAAAVERTLERMPDWYAEVGSDTTRFIGKATALSGDLQTAVDIAKADARADLLFQVETRTAAMTKHFREQTGSADPVLLSQFTAVSRDVAAQSLRGLRLRKHDVLAEGELYRAYVAVELPTGEAAKQLLERLRRDERLHTELRAERAFEELTREVERYEASRQVTAPPID